MAVVTVCTLNFALHMVRHCLPQVLAFWKAWSITKATLGRYPRSSSSVNRGKKMAMGEIGRAHV